MYYCKKQKELKKKQILKPNVEIKIWKTDEPFEAN